MKPLQINCIQAPWYTSDWWIGALSMIITARGPGKGLQNGTSLFLMKSWNNSCEKEPCSISQVRKPLTVYAERTDHRSLRSKGMFSWGRTPFGDQPYFRWLVRSFAADSSTNMSWLGIYIDTLCAHAALSSGFLCVARNWIRKLEISAKMRVNIVPASLTTWLASTSVESFVHEVRHQVLPRDSIPAHRYTEMDVLQGIREESIG